MPDDDVSEADAVYRIRIGHPVSFDCCDCGLRHHEVYTLDPNDGSVIICRTVRDDEATATNRTKGRITIAIHGDP